MEDPSTGINMAPGPIGIQTDRTNQSHQQRQPLTSSSPKLARPEVIPETPQVERGTRHYSGYVDQRGNE